MMILALAASNAFDVANATSFIAMATSWGKSILVLLTSGSFWTVNGVNILRLFTVIGVFAAFSHVIFCILRSMGIGLMHHHHHKQGLMSAITDEHNMGLLFRFLIVSSIGMGFWQLPGYMPGSEADVVNISVFGGKKAPGHVLGTDSASSSLASSVSDAIDGASDISTFEDTLKTISTNISLTSIMRAAYQASLKSQIRASSARVWTKTFGQGIDLAQVQDSSKVDSGWSFTNLLKMAAGAVVTGFWSCVSLIYMLFLKIANLFLEYRVVRVLLMNAIYMLLILALAKAVFPVTLVLSYWPSLRGLAVQAVKNVVILLLAFKLLVALGDGLFTADRVAEWLGNDNGQISTALNDPDQWATLDGWVGEQLKDFAAKGGELKFDDFVNYCQNRHMMAQLTGGVNFGSLVQMARAFFLFNIALSICGRAFSVLADAADGRLSFQAKET